MATAKPEQGTDPRPSAEPQLARARPLAGPALPAATPRLVAPPQAQRARTQGERHSRQPVLLQQRRAWAPAKAGARR